jgi:hypothetical protein
MNYNHPMTWTRVHGKIAQGYRVASGPSADYPYGALDRQRPIFEARGLDLSHCFNGTLNLDIRPRTFQMLKPEFTFHDVEWTDLHPPEHFSFSRCKVIFRDVEYDGFVYYPHPETKIRNFQNPSLVEVIAMPIPEIKYGDEVDVLVNDDEINIQPSHEGFMHRNRLVMAVLAMVIIIALSVAGFWVWRLKNNQPQIHSKSQISKFGYCSPEGSQPCVVSFGLEADGNMLVNLLVPPSYPDFYLKALRGSEENLYDCNSAEQFPTSVYCTGREIYPGEKPQFLLVAADDDRVLAEGTFTIIGLLLASPKSDATATSPAVIETSTPILFVTPTPMFLESPTPVPLDIITPAQSYP